MVLWRLRLDAGLWIRDVIAFFLSASFSGNGDSLLNCADCGMLNTYETMIVLSPFMEINLIQFAPSHTSPLFIITLS